MLLLSQYGRSLCSSHTFSPHFMAQAPAGLLVRHLFLSWFSTIVSTFLSTRHVLVSHIHLHPTFADTWISNFYDFLTCWRDALNITVPSHGSRRLESCWTRAFLLPQRCDQSPYSTTRSCNFGERLIIASYSYLGSSSSTRLSSLTMAW